jgi:hypothetical protein
MHRIYIVLANLMYEVCILRKIYGACISHTILISHYINIACKSILFGGIPFGGSPFLDRLHIYLALNSMIEMYL